MNVSTLFLSQLQRKYNESNKEKTKDIIGVNYIKSMPSKITLKLMMIWCLIILIFDDVCNVSSPKFVNE